MAITREKIRAYRKQRVRKKIHGTAMRPRLAVHKTLKHVYAQIIDDETGVTLASASTHEKDMKGSTAGATVEKAKVVGAAIAKRAQEKNVKSVVFDRGRSIYHGRVKAVAEAAREGGLEF